MGKRQHEIPRFYLGQFTDAADGMLWTYDFLNDLARKNLPENTGLETHLYSVTKTDGTRATDIEDWIAGVEAKAAPLFPDLLAGAEIKGQARADLASFFALTHVRTNSFRRQYAEIKMGMRQARMKVIASNDKLFDAWMQKYERDTGAKPPEERKILRDGMLNPQHLGLSVHREYTLRALTVHDHVAPILFDMNWTIARAEGNRDFITCDNPLAKEAPRDSAFPSGFLHKRIEVTMPLSPRHCWLAYWGDDRGRLMALSESTVKLSNRIRAVYAERFVYCHQFDGGIRALGRKYRDTKPHFELSVGETSPVSLRRR